MNAKSQMQIRNHKRLFRVCTIFNMKWASWTVNTNIRKNYVNHFPDKRDARRAYGKKDRFVGKVSKVSWYSFLGSVDVGGRSKCRRNTAGPQCTRERSERMKIFELGIRTALELNWSIKLCVERLRNGGRHAVSLSGRPASLNVSTKKRKGSNIAAEFKN